MSRDHSSVTTNCIGFGIATLGAMLNGKGNVSISFWINPDSWAASSSDLIGIAQSAGAQPMFDLYKPGLAVGRVDGLAYTQNYNVDPASLSTGAWHHVCITQDFSGSFSKTYFDGILKNSATLASTGVIVHTPSATTGDSFGCWLNGSATVPAASDAFDGKLCELAIWSATLDAAEVASLAKRFSARKVRPSALLLYTPILGVNSPEPDLIGRRNATITGTIPKADHCPIIF